MKKTLISLSILLPLISLLAACEETPTRPAPEIIAYPQVHLDSPDLRGRVKITNIATERVGDKQLKANITLQNLSPLPISIDYQYQFLNNAYVSELSRPGITTTIAPYSSATLTIVSNSSQATTFDLSIVHRK